MGRLENIIARNRRPHRSRERLLVSFGFGALVLLILVLMVFTDLGLPPAPSGRGQAPPEATAPRARDGTRVDGVLLRGPTAAGAVRR